MWRACDDTGNDVGALTDGPSRIVPGNYNHGRMFDNVRRVTRQVAAYGSAAVALQVVNFLLLPVFTRVLSEIEYGAFTILIAWEAGLKIVYRWGLESSFLRLYFDQGDRSEDYRRTLAGTIAIILAAANGAILVGLTMASGALSAWLGTIPSFRAAFVLLVVNSFISGFFFLPYTLYRAREDARRAVALTFGQSVATTIARLVLVVGFHLGVLGLVLADVIVSIGVTIALIPTYRSMMRWRFSQRLAVESLQYGLPQVPFGLLHQVMAYADRVLLPLLLPGDAAARLAQLGLYQIGVSIANALKLLPVAFQTAWMPFAFDTATRRPDAALLFSRLATYSLGVLALLTAGMIALTDVVVRLILPPNFHEAAAVVPILTLGIAAQSAGWFPTTSLNVAKATKYYPVVTAIAAVSAVASQVALIPRYGVFGAAAGAAIGQAVQALATLIVAQRVYPIPYERARLGKIVAVGVITTVIAELISFDRPLVTAIARAAVVLTCFPAGLFLTRLFTTSEMRDLRTLAETVRTRLRPVPPELPS